MDGGIVSRKSAEGRFQAPAARPVCRALSCSVTMRKRGRLVRGAIVVCLTAGSWLFVIRFPDHVFCAYSQARSWLATLAPIQKLSPPALKARDAVPCRGTLEPVRSSAPDQYFPPGVLDCDQWSEEFLRDWYSKQLTALNEPSLWVLSRSDSRAKVYRFLWLRTFHHPISVRLTLKPDLTGILISKITGGAGGYEPGSLIRNESIPVGKQRTTVFLARIVQSHYWDLPSRRQPGGLDGAQWILEGITDGHYQIVDRWSPGEADPIRTLAMTLLSDLAGIQIDPREVY
jgi:hypothetical protein